MTDSEFRVTVMFCNHYQKINVETFLTMSNVANNYRNFSRKPQKTSEKRCFHMCSDEVNDSNHFNVSSTVTLNSVHTESGIYQHNFDEQIDEEQ